MTSHGVRLSDDDSSLVRHFHNRVRKCAVYVEHFYIGSPRGGGSGPARTGSGGTGTVIAFQGNATDGWLPIMATAAHVLENKYTSVSRFRISLYSVDVPAKPTARVLDFDAPVDVQAGPRDPCVVRYSGPFHEIIDVGLIRGPLKCTDGTAFFSQDPKYSLMPIEPEADWTSEGTRVAWAGYPQLAATFARRPQLCYFEGCVSSLVLRDDFQAYLLDGHNTFGISGGPVWAAHSDNESPRMIGIISGYQSLTTSPQMPGLVHAAPIQPITFFLTNIWNARMIERRDVGS